MGRRGPIPNPSSGESKRGRNTLKRKGAPQKQTSVESPKFLKAKPLALEFWDRHAPDLIAVKRLQPLQAELFGTICEMAAEVRELTNDVSSEGYVVEGRRGQEPNPKVRLLRDARRDLLAAARGFGLDAASDARLPAEPPEETAEPNPLLRYLT
jgi:P27 family predicted phage terminase small subunit